jgi:hypothetical protein
MKNKSKQKVTLVEESDYGLYLWETDDGKLICDEDSNYLNIPAKKGDAEKINLLKLAARDCGIEGGRAVFFSGNRRVTDEEYEYQKQRLEWGLTPDEKDYGSARDELLNHSKGLKL